MINKPDKWLIDGIMADAISIYDRGLLYGDGLFETIAVRNGECRFLDAHLRRLEQGCVRLHIPAPNIPLLCLELEDLVKGVSHGVAKIIVTRGRGTRGYRPPAICSPTRIIGIMESQPSKSPGSGVRVRFCTTQISRNPLLAGLKTLNRLEQVMARSEWNDLEIAEGLMFDDREQAISGTMSNLFVGRDGALYTPSLAECGIPGIMRRMAISVAIDLGISVQERPIAKEELIHADEVFLTNALIGLWPVTQLENRLLAPGPLSEAVRKGLAARGVIECSG